MQLHKGQSQADKLQHSLSERELEVAMAKAAVDTAKKEAWALRGELKAHAEAAAKVQMRILRPSMRTRNHTCGAKDLGLCMSCLSI